MRKGVLGAAALVAAWVFSVASSSRLPEQVTVRWNIEFEPSGEVSRSVAAIVVPSLMLLLPALAWLLSRIDPRRDSYERHRTTYWLIWNMVMVFLALLQVVSLGAALGWPFDTARLFPLLVGGLFVVLGNYLPRLRPNWFVGIRTPWSLSDDEVWARTHRVGGPLLMVGGALLMLGALVAEEWLRGALWLVAAVTGILIPIVYSYVAWRGLGRPRRARRVKEA